MAPARPAGWGTEYVLERLEAGEKITRICAVAAKGLPVKWTTLYQEIRAWRKHEPDFEEQYQFWMSENARRFGGLRREKRVGGGSHLPPGWQKLWIRTYLESGCNAIETTRRMEDLYGIKVSMSTINQMRNPSHALFNEDFKREMDEAKPLRVEMNAGILYDIVDDESVDPRTRMNAAIQINERLDKENWGRSTHMIHSGQVSHKHEIANEMAAYRELVDGRFEGQRQLESGERRELDVVDTEAVEVEA